MRGLRLAISATLVASLTLGAPPHRAVAAACDTGGSPTTTVYLPNITKTLGGPSGWVTPFIVQNVGFVSTTLEVSFYRFSDGSLVSCRKVSQVDVGTSFADVPNNDTDLPDNSQFSVVARSYGSEIVAVVNEHAGSGSRAEALSYVGLSSGATRVALPYVAKSVDGWLTTLVVQNLGTSTTTVTASFASFDGTETASLTRRVAPGRSAFIDPSVESALESGTEYAVLLTASQPLGAIVNAHNDAPTASRPMGFSYNGVAVDPFSDAYVPYVARNADSIDRTSRVIVQNAGTSSATPTLTFRKLGGGSSVTITAPAALAPGRSWPFEPGMKADGVTACPSGGGSGCVAEGEHSLVVSGGEFAVLGTALSPATAMAFTGAAPSRSRVFLPNVTRKLGGSTGWTTPIVVQSAGATEASLRWFRFEDGRLVTQQSVTGLSDGVSVRVDPRSVSGLADNTQYAVVLDAPGAVTAVVTELSSAGGDGAMIYEGFAGLVEPEAVPAIVRVTPGPVTLALGGGQQFSASVTDQFGDRSTWPVSWEVSPSELGSISSSGLFTARGYGSGKIVATSGAASGSATVTVNGTAPAAAVTTSLGYSYVTVPTARGTFGVHLIKERLSDVTVKTVTANSSDCEASCFVRPLADHVAEAGAYAGMNGTYLCPPDYSWCASKVNSYDYAVYNSALGKWLNRWALVSPSNALVTVARGTPRFYRHTYSYDRDDVTAAISNFPILLLGGAVVDTEAEQADYQKQLGTKGSIGTDGTHVFLALVTGASVTDSAYVLQALGVRDAMNLDGGGTSAMYIGGEYKAGPGRLLPNAVLLTKP